MKKKEIFDLSFSVSPVLSAISVLAFFLTTCCSAQATKKLIEFGWDEPDTAFMRRHIAQMEQTPFDGVVFTALASDSTGKKVNFMNECWGKRAFKHEELSQALDDLQKTPFKKFKYNFLRFNVVPGSVDWFDDFTPIIDNAKLAAQVAHGGHAKGILFDIEQYNSPLFDYSKAKGAKTKSFDDYAKQARLRGREIMNAFQQGYPNVTIFLTYGYCLPYAQVKNDRSKLATVNYGLLAPFLDGLFDAARGDAKIVDGFEISYTYKTDEQFDKVPKELKSDLLPLVGANHDNYLKHLSVSFGLWMDNDWRAHGWDTQHFDKNFFTPQQFQKSVSKALATADDYVWIYTEKPQWWSPPNGAPKDLPADYADAVAKARASQK